MDNEIRNLSNAIIGEIFLALGFSKYGLAYKTFSGLFRKAANRLSSIAIKADCMILTDGFPEAAEWMMKHWCRLVSYYGKETIPSTGPLLIISNHAGTYDTFILTSIIGRNDIKLIASDVPFLKKLPNANSHLFFLSDDIQDRMRSARAGIQHLKDGGALLLYGTGLIDPDPQVYEKNAEWIEKWLSSINLFVRAVPDSQIVLSIVSGVVTKYWAHHPVTLLARQDWKKRRLSEFSQVVYQLFRPGRIYLEPRVSLSSPIIVDTLRGEAGSDKILPAVVAKGKQLLEEHCKTFSNCAILIKEKKKQQTTYLS